MSKMAGKCHIYVRVLHISILVYQVVVVNIQTLFCHLVKYVIYIISPINKLRVSCRCHRSSIDICEDSTRSSRLLFV